MMTTLFHPCPICQSDFNCVVTRPGQADSIMCSNCGTQATVYWWQNRKPDEKLAKLRGFVNKIIDSMDGWSDVGGDDIQNAGVEFGVIEAHSVAEPCNYEGCYCLNYYGSNEFPLDCHRKAPWLTDER